MAAPKKPDYARLRRIAEQRPHINLSDQAFLLSVADRAEWLEAQRSEKPVVSLPPVAGGGKVFKGMDPKGGKRGG